MAKRPRLKGAGLYHHIYNRGNNRHPLFKDIADYKRYLEYLFRYSADYKIDIICYALLEWHIHLFIFDWFGKVSKFMNIMHGEYAHIFNKIHKQIGHVFEGRFKNKVVDANNYGLWLSRYIHCQAVEAGIVKKSEDYEWTSYRVYLGMEKNPNLKTDIILSQFGNNEFRQRIAYRQFVEGNDDGPIDWRAVEFSSQSIIGDREFIEQINLKLQHKKLNKKEKILNPLKMMSEYLGVSMAVLSRPHGEEQKRLRQRAIMMVANKYDIGVREIAKIFNVSPSLVSHILKKI